PALARPAARWVALAGAGLALALVPFVPAGVPVIAAAAVAVLAGLKTGSAAGPTDLAEETR
ncbi:MAG: hypothetical protein QOF52_2002, partial [Propionibacteriaceae bacterium]|nr:hypothetical protein [Propionibacteriaceae bacterium]